MPRSGRGKVTGAAVRERADVFVGWGALIRPVGPLLPLRSATGEGDGGEGLRL